MSEPACDICSRAFGGADEPDDLGKKNDALKLLSIIARRPEIALCVYCVNTAVRGAQVALDEKLRAANAKRGETP